MRFPALLALVAALALHHQVQAAAVADMSADLSVPLPAFEKDKGPIVAIDAGHLNFHTLEGRYAPFGRLLANDGFRVMSLKSALTRESLTGVSILVISNPLHSSNAIQWSLPTPSAFTASEIAAVETWVRDGGSLWLIADHMPFAGAAADLAAVFGVTFLNGFAFHTPTPLPVDMFTVNDGSLRADIIRNGRISAEEVTRVAAFTGSAFRTPPHARPLMALPATYVILMPQTAWAFDADTPLVPASGTLMGAALAHGRGRVAVFSEAGMFTAQVEETNTSVRTGFHAPGAEQNKQFVLNVAHWLVGLLGP